LLPALLLAGEYLLERQSSKAVLWFSVVIAFVILGGMPESALLLLSFTVVYLVFRIWTDAALRSTARRSVMLLAISYTAGICISAFQLLPFYEFLTHSSNIHDPSQIHGHLVGTDHDALDISAVTYLFPLRFGPLYAAAFQHPPVRNYFGLLTVLLVILAFGGFRLHKRTNRPLDLLTLFFSVSALLIVLKKYGFVAVNWIGLLPGFRLVIFPKYEEPILSFCICGLCAIGIERIKRGEASKRLQWIALGCAGLILVVAAIATRPIVGEEIRLGHVLATSPKLAIWLSGSLLLVVFAALITDAVRNIRLISVLAVLLAVELSFNYVIPIYRIHNRLPSVRSNPYAGAAYVRFLQSKAHDDSRILGRDWMLVPGWASVFNLFDIRDMDALFYNKYFTFLRNFLPPMGPELRSSFLGTSEYYFSSSLERRLLQFSSVKYLLTGKPFAAPNRRIDEILRQNQGHLLRGKENLVGRSDFVLGGTARAGLGEHPPYERLPYKLTVGDAQGRFHFSYALNPAVFHVSSGDGVGFTVEVRDSSGKIEKLFSNYIDPKHNLTERRWIDGELDLSRYRGQEITLLFSTDPGPRGDSSFDWAAWSDFRFDGEPQESAPPFKLVYDAEAKIYQYDDVLPRAAVYYDAAVEKDEAGVLQRLADPSLEVFRTVVLDGSKLTKRQAEIAGQLGHAAANRVEAARIQRYQSQAVEIEASLSRAGILVLNDSDYPGWRVSIDGRPGEWFTANYLFRGVLLGPGRHVVKFEYRPASFYWGVAVSLVTCCLVAGFMIANARRDRPRHARDLQTPQRSRLPA
jgi:hypothetical protein